MKRSVRRLAWFAAVLGAIVAGCGIAAAFAPLVVIGGILVCAGVWNLFRTSIGGLIVDGLAMILTGALTGLMWLWIEEARASSAANWIVTGVIQLVWGFRRLALYPTARRTADDRPAIAQLESIVRELSQRSAKADPTVAEFRTGRIRRHRNRLGLYTDGAVALLDHQVVRLERRADIWIEARGTTWLGRGIKVQVRMGDLQLTGEMPAGQFERFDRWKSGLTRASSIAA